MQGNVAETDLPDASSGDSESAEEGDDTPGDATGLSFSEMLARGHINLDVGEETEADSVTSIELLTGLGQPLDGSSLVSGAASPSSCLQPGAAVACPSLHSDAGADSGSDNLCLRTGDEKAGPEPLQLNESPVGRAAWRLASQTPV